MEILSNFPPQVATLRACDIRLSVVLFKPNQFVQGLPQGTLSNYINAVLSQNCRNCSAAGVHSV